MLLPFLLATHLALADYQNITVEGWSVHVEASLVAQQPALWSAAQLELRRQLQNIVRVVPDGPLAELKKVPLWMHVKSPGTVGLAYHPGAPWLKEHGMNPEMAKGVEIGSASNFVSWTYEQPWCVMHELAHSYHDRVLEGGFENKEVKAAYDHAMATKIYESVRRYDGSMQKHYATTNPMEYFAETTEAYFGTNDFFPFVRGELMIADQDGYKLMQSIWGSPVKRVPK